MMHIGWSTLLKRYFNRTAKKYRLGMALTEQGVHISVSEKISGQWCWSRQHFIDMADWPLQLKPWVSKQGLQFSRCNLVLPSSKYQIIQVDRPPVEDAEMPAALGWAVKDMLSLQDDVQVDYFELPAQAAGANKVSVVVSPRKEIVALANILHNAELQPESISIEETVMLSGIDSNNEAVAVLYQHAGQEVSLSIYKQGQIYFTRRLKGYELLSSLSIDDLNNGMLEALATEIQRSMDYFDSQLHQAGLRKIALMLDSDYQQEIASGLKNLLFIDVANVKPEVRKQEDLIMRHAYMSSVVASQMQAGTKAAKAEAA